MTTLDEYKGWVTNLEEMLDDENLKYVAVVLEPKRMEQYVEQRETGNKRLHCTPET